MIKRACEGKFQRLLNTFPVVLVVGPRQAGKTTLVQHVLKDWRYMDLERQKNLELLSADAEGYFQANPSRVIIDEAQRYPELFPMLRHVVDQDRRPGRFVLTGSAHPSLLRQAGETLAGRAAVLELTPFQVDELIHEPRWRSWRWFWGGYPPLYRLAAADQRVEWLEQYIKLFLEQELPNLGVSIAPMRLRRLWTMLAHVHGQILKVADLARAMDLSSHTINHYLDVLEGGFMIRRLAPFAANIGKRIVKSPKLYIRDSGLLHYFSGLRRPEELREWPKVGASFEGWVVEETAQRVSLEQTGAAVYFWRTQAGGEVDLIVEADRRRVAIEIKSGRTIDRYGLVGLRTCMKDLEIPRGYLVYGGTERMKIGQGMEAIGWEEFQHLPSHEWLNAS